MKYLLFFIAATILPLLAFPAGFTIANVPEPGSMIVIGLGLIAVATLVRRKR